MRKMLESLERVRSGMRETDERLGPELRKKLDAKGRVADFGRKTEELYAGNLQVLACNVVTIDREVPNATEVEFLKRAVESGRYSREEIERAIADNVLTALVRGEEIDPDVADYAGRCLKNTIKRDPSFVDSIDAALYARALRISPD